jgi:uncharacterized protein (DUF849 family)
MPQVAGSPVIIEAAVNGTTTKDRQPHVPRIPREVTDDALACLAAGASVLHNHPGDGVWGGPNGYEFYVEAWRPLLRAQPDALIYPTAGRGETIEEQYAHVPLLAEHAGMRIAYVDPGSVNLGGADAEGLPADNRFIYANSFHNIRYKMRVCQEHHLGPSIAIFEPGFLRVALAYYWAGKLPPGAMIKLYFGGNRGAQPQNAAWGVGFGLPPTCPSLEAYLAMLEGCDLPWSVALLGGDVLESEVARLALERGGHLRVGLEDYAGPRTPTNVELVRAAAALCAEVGRPLASSTEAAATLGLPQPVSLTLRS